MADNPDRDCVPESELDRLTTEQLLDYLVKQRDAGRPDCAKKALGVLAFGYMNLVRAIISEKVPPEDVDDQAAIVMEAALKSAFEGKSVGEFVNWLKMIARRRGIADLHRDREKGLETKPLTSEHGGDETVFGTEPATESEANVIHIQEAAARVYEQRSPEHQRVIQLYGPNGLGFFDLSARETVEEFRRLHQGSDMSEDNVHQIWKRFKSDLDDELGMRAS